MHKTSLYPRFPFIRVHSKQVLRYVISAFINCNLENYIIWIKGVKVNGKLTVNQNQDCLDLQTWVNTEYMCLSCYTPPFLSLRIYIQGLIIAASKKIYNKSMYYITLLHTLVFILPGFWPSRSSLGPWKLGKAILAS